MSELEAVQHMHHQHSQMSHHHYDAGGDMTCQRRGIVPLIPKDLFGEMWFDASPSTLMPPRSSRTKSSRTTSRCTTSMRSFPVEWTTSRRSWCTDNNLDILILANHLMIEFFKVHDLYYQINFEKKMHAWWMLA